MTPTMQHCLFPDCERKVSTMKLCNAHYLQQRKGKALHPARGKGPNRYEEREEYFVLFLTDVQGKEVAETWVSKEDFESVRYTRWYLDVKGYVRRGNPKVQIHRQILAPPTGMHIDHVNRNKLDNRRENLRVVTGAENAQNVTTREGMRGVEERTGRDGRKRWVARCKVGSTRYYAGTFYTQEEAAEAAKELRNCVMPFAID